MLDNQVIHTNAFKNVYFPFFGPITIFYLSNSFLGFARSWAK